MLVSRYLPDRNRPMLAWQRPILPRMLRFDNPALFIDMRLGKSFLSVEYCIRKDLKKVLVLCPKTAIVSWRTELRLEDLKYHILDSAKTKKAATTSKELGWYMASLATIQDVPLNINNWDAIIIDESSRMKNPRSLTANLLIKYYSKIPHKILLSGTPNPEDITETVTQLIFKDGSCLGCKSYWEFRVRHMKLLGFDWVLNPGVYQRLRELLNKTCIFLSQEGAGWDTTVIKEKVYFDLNTSQKKHILELLDHFEMEINGKFYSTKYMMAQTTWMRQVACGYFDRIILNDAKEKWLVKFIKDNPGKKFIFWFAFNEEIFRIQEVLKAAGIKGVGALWGKRTLDERILAQNAFQEGSLDYLLIQVKLGQYALDLHKASKAIYFSNSHSGEERTQSEKRISHTKRTEPPSYIDLIFKDSIEEEILQNLKEKHFSFKMVWSKLARNKEKLKC
jgi:SNF2 family DNA or RNA helicase